MKFRPPSMVVASILNLFFGVWGIASSLSAAVIKDLPAPAESPLMGLPLTVEQQKSLESLGTIGGLASFPIGVAAIVSGLGLWWNNRWARGWTYGYAITELASIALYLVGGIIIYFMMADGLSRGPHDPQETIFLGIVAPLFVGGVALVRGVYPVILLFLLRCPSWNGGFRRNGPGPATPPPLPDGPPPIPGGRYGG